MIGRKQIKYNTPFLYLTKREGKNIYDLFILIEVLEGTQVVFPSSEELSEILDHKGINISITTSDQDITLPSEPKYKRYTFRPSEELSENLNERKIIVRTITDNADGMVLREMSIAFDQKYEMPAIPDEEEVAVDCPYFYLGIKKLGTASLPILNGALIWAFTPFILIPTYTNKISSAGLYVPVNKPNNNEMTINIEIEPAEEEGYFNLERLNQATFYAEDGSKRDFEVKLWKKGEEIGRYADKDTDKKKKKAKTSHGGSSKGKPKNMITGSGLNN